MAIPFLFITLSGIFVALAVYLLIALREYRIILSSAEIDLHAELPAARSSTMSEPWFDAIAASIATNLNRRIFTSSTQVVDSLGAANRKWLDTQLVACVATAFVEVIPVELAASQKVLEHGLRHLAEIGTSMESLLERALPAGLFHWYETSAIGKLVDSIHSKYDAIHSGGIHFTPEGTDIDVGLVVPWITLVLSSCRELQLLSRGDTNLGRALYHVTLDVAAVGTGMFVGSVIGGGLLSVFCAVLDCTCTFGLATAVAVSSGIVGGVVAKTGARYIKFQKLESLSHDFSNQAKEVQKLSESCNKKVSADITKVHARIEKCRIQLLRRSEVRWKACVEALFAAGDLRLQAFGKCSSEILSVSADFYRRRVLLLEQTAGRFSRFTPSGVARATVARRLVQIASVFESAASQLVSPKHSSVACIEEALKVAQAIDPFDMIAPWIKLLHCGHVNLHTAADAVMGQHRIAVKRQFGRLEIRRAKSEQQITKWLENLLHLPLEKLRELDTAMRLEAAALGMR